MEELEADFRQMHMTEEIERHNKRSDEKELLPMAIDDVSTEAKLLLATDVDDQLLVPKEVHHFYFVVKFPPYKDLSLKLRIEEIERLIQKKSEAQFQVTKKLEERKMDQASLHSELSWRLPNKNSFRDLIASRMKDMETLQQCLKKLHPNYSNKNPTTLPSHNIVARAPYWEVNVISEFQNLCYWYRKYRMEDLRKWLDKLRDLRNPAERDNSPLEELHCFKKNLNKKMQHGSRSLANEKKLLKEIKHIEAAQEKVIAKEKPVFPYHLGSKKDIHKHIEILRDDMDQLKEEDRAFRTHRKLVKINLNASEGDIRILERKQDDIKREKDEAYQCLLQLLKQNEANECYQQHLSLLNKAKELAKKKDVESLKELSNRQVEEFMYQWNSSKDFRDEYVNKIKPSQDINGEWSSEGLERILLGKSRMMQLRPGGKTLGNNKCKPNKLSSYYWRGLFHSHKF